MVVNTDVSGYSFEFRGKVERFFILWVVNVLLSIITFGIYLPWAVVKVRKYMYENISLQGDCFRYNVTGKAVFISWLLLGLIVSSLSLISSILKPTLLPVVPLIFFLLAPLLIMKGLRYQAMMTSLNNVRFGFRYAPGRAFWVMLALPIIVSIPASLLLAGGSMFLSVSRDITSTLIEGGIIVMVLLLVFSVVNGVVYGKLMQWFGDNSYFGTQAFSVQISIKRCIVIFILSFLILIPFMVGGLLLLASLFMNVAVAVMNGGVNVSMLVSVMHGYMLNLAASYLLGIIGIILSVSYLLTALRNTFINGLQLGNLLTFRSGLSYSGMFMQFVVLTLATALTLGLAYPWAKIRYMRYIVENVTIYGDLSTALKEDSDAKNDTGLLAVLSRGILR